ncbi:TetR/AcrR family transcriptional regulator [Sciscionella marina]|uniref:TetR/AcrR family transcriptional regulator n=1 Tax=Sciscionella marina TaxID=508770 RepID=UPI00037379DD|nr:TetR/AcrR family transcriptional regulator [Sciscionella marina]
MSTSSSDTPATTRRSGRPRSERARAAILRSAEELLDEEGYTAVTMDAIASRSGASKATLYRWWPNKAAVVMDAYFEHNNPDISFPDTGSLHADLVQQLSAVVHGMNDTVAGHLLARLIADAQYDEGLAESLRGRFISARRADAVAAIERGRARGQLRHGADPEVLVDLLYGALYYRLLVTGQHTGTGYVHTLLGQLGISSPTESG